MGFKENNQLLNDYSKNNINNYSNSKGQDSVNPEYHAENMQNQLGTFYISEKILRSFITIQIEILIIPGRV